MKLGELFLKHLNKKYPPSAKQELHLKGYDLLLVTDDAGNAIQAFVGKADAHGVIKGDRYARTLKYDKEGKLIKDHWERKGKAS